MKEIKWKPFIKFTRNLLSINALSSVDPTREHNSCPKNSTKENMKTDTFIQVWSQNKEQKFLKVSEKESSKLLSVPTSSPEVSMYQQSMLSLILISQLKEAHISTESVVVVVMVKLVLLSIWLLKLIKKMSSKLKRNWTQKLTQCPNTLIKAFIHETSNLPHLLIEF